MSVSSKSLRRAGAKEWKQAVNQTPVLIGIAFIAAFHGYLTVFWIDRSVGSGLMGGAVALLTRLRDLAFHPNEDSYYFLVSMVIAALPASVWGLVAGIAVRRSGGRPGVPGLCAGIIALLGPAVVMFAGEGLAWLVLTPAIIGLLASYAAHQRQVALNMAISIGLCVAISISFSLFMFGALLFFALW